MFTFHSVRPSLQPIDAFDALDRMIGHLRGFEVQLRRSPESTTPRTPAVDVTETELGYVLSLEVPGVNKEDVRIFIEGSRVRVSAEPAGPVASAQPPTSAAPAATTAPAVPVEPGAGAQPQNSEQTEGPPVPEAAPSSERVIHRERRRARFDRTIELAHDIDPAQAVAKLDSGVLTLRLRKQKVPGPAIVEVQ